jgi:hypothetical protein
MELVAFNRKSQANIDLSHHNFSKIQTPNTSFHRWSTILLTRNGNPVLPRSCLFRLTSFHLLSRANFTEESPWDSNSWSDIVKKFLSWKSEVHYCVRKSQPLDPTLKQINLVHPLTLLTIYLCLSLPSGLFPSNFQTKILYAFFCPLVLNDPPILSPLGLIILILYVKEYNYETPHYAFISSFLLLAVLGQHIYLCLRFFLQVWELPDINTVILSVVFLFCEL